MNSTHIHLSKTLEKILKKHVQKEASGEPGIIGRWNATVFYVQRKKVLFKVSQRPAKRP